MRNLSATFPVQKDPTLPGLPVLVDLTWHGQIMTSDKGGIIPSRSASSTFRESDDSIIL
jgi:hypothetical protein